MNETTTQESSHQEQRVRQGHIVARAYGHVRRRIVAGLLTLVPVAATFIVLRYVFDWMDSLAAPLIQTAIDLYIPGLGILLTLALVYLVGFLTASVVGRRTIGWGESMLMRLPIVKIVYNPVKKLLGTFAMNGKTRTWQTVLVEYPRRDAWMLAFVAGELPDSSSGAKMVSVFIPNTPNPAAGRVIIVPRHDVCPINVPVDDAIEFVVSGGTAIAPSMSAAALAICAQKKKSDDSTLSSVPSKKSRMVPPSSR